MDSAPILTGARRSIWMVTRPFLLALLMCLSLTVYWLDSSAGQTANQATAASQAAAAPTNVVIDTWPAYGVNHISFPAANPTSEQRYANGLSTGATWNRWPLYWHDIEQQPGDYSWAYQDTAVRADIAHGLKLDAILLGTPSFYRTDALGNRPTPTPAAPAQPTSPLTLDEAQTGTPLGLYTAVFTDGSDIPGPGKAINPENVWARFVNTAVNRYKPGGLIAQQTGWPDGVGVTHWEIWNEPDLAHFWDGTAADYARLLKVGYLAAKHADAHAQIIFGGLAVVYDPYDIPFLSSVLAIYDQDPTAVHFDYFHDILALHNYSYAYRSWRAVYVAGRRLADYKLEKPIWLNETGVPVWDDYPGPVCDPLSPYRATMTEQADFIIQSTLYATYAGADNLFFFQLYDDCGNVSLNPDYFPPDQCAAGPPPNYAGDAFGLFTNDANAACYAHHPQPGTGRPGLAAFQALTTYFQDVTALWRQRPTPGQEWVAFYQPSTQSRVVGLWALTAITETAVLTTTNNAQTGLLVHPDGLTETLTATNGVFTLTLPAATNQNTSTDQPFNPIGGRPYLLIEPDTLPPTVSADAPPKAALSVVVSWFGEDWGSGLASYDVLVQKDASLPTAWLMGTTAVSGDYPVEMDHTYTFKVMGRDGAGNLSEGTAVTVYAPLLDKHLYLPIIGR